MLAGLPLSLLGLSTPLAAEEASPAPVADALPLTKRVDAAVAKGVAWLTSAQEKDGTFGTTFGKNKVPAPVISHAGHRLGRLALTLYTLSHCGIKRNALLMQRGLRPLRREYRMLLEAKAPPGEGPTYAVSLILMLLHELFSREAIQFDEDGTILRNRQKPTQQNPLGLPHWAEEMTGACARWLISVRSKNGLYGYPTGPTPIPKKSKLSKAMRKWIKKNAGTDNSNTQFALLGLWAASRLGVRPTAAFLRQTAEGVLATQSPTGPAVRRRWEPEGDRNPADERYAGPEDHARGFPYGPTAPVRSRKGGSKAIVTQIETGSMTAGGLSSLLIVKAMLTESTALDDKHTAALDKGIWDALAWLSSHFSPERNPMVVNHPGAESYFPPGLPVILPKPGDMPNTWQLYYLYGLERACMIAGKRYLGTHDWYGKGAEVILSWQGEDGSFQPQNAVVGGVATAWQLPNLCFALLFLKRASMRPVAPLLRTTAPDSR